ncbi:unnamed protein product [Parnassius mnemosyne]|uniref:Odorant receptor n=1 Tax=Parnassius mnemosyne TaxID=213953 RepID=A0AAV1KIZ5_9NEOP
MKYLSNFHPEFVQPLLVGFKMLDKFNLTFFDDNVSFLKRYWKFLYLVPFTVAFITCMSIYMINIFSEEIDVTEFAYMVPVYISFVTGVIKATIVLLKRSDIKNLIYHLGNMWRTSNLTDKQIEKKKNLLKTLKYFQLVFYWSDIIGAWQHLTTPLLLVLFRTFILQEDCELALPFGSVYPYDPTENWFKYLATYAFQSFAMLREVYIYIGTDFLLMTLSAHLAIAFALLREDLVNVAPTNIKNGFCNNSTDGQQTNEESYVKISIQDFICRHQKLIELAALLNDVFNIMIFVNLLFITIIACFFGFATTVARGIVEMINNLVAVLALLLPTYLLCYYGELLRNESLRIADSAYTNLWYKGDVYYQKMINIIIIRSQRPCCLTSLKHVPVTLNSFTKVLSTTWSYFSVATSIYFDKE